MTFLRTGRQQQPRTLLYGGLEPASTGEIIDETRKAGRTQYDPWADAIFVGQKGRDAVRFFASRDRPAASNRSGLKS